MDGLLIVDKPSGPTSHDVVARVRRALRERRIGHTGTLDPLASGVLPLVIGRATRLARFLSGDKTYTATIRLGVSTDSYDSLGTPDSEVFVGPWPERSTIASALARFSGTFMQRPPAFSAKKIAGQRSYARARRGAASGKAGVEVEAASVPGPVEVTVHSVELVDAAADLVTLSVRCSAGFYVRSLAHDLGGALGTGAHLVALRRTEAAGVRIDRAVALDIIEGEHGLVAAEDELIPMHRMLHGFPFVALNDSGVAHVRVGRNLGPTEASGGFVEAVEAASGPERQPVRLLSPSGELVAMAEAADVPGLLHPAVVLM